jgi:PmbA protein
MIVNELVEKAMTKAQGAQASLGKSESTYVAFENDELKSMYTSQSTSVDVKVILDGKIGSSNTSDVNDVDGVVARALEAAEFGSPAHFQFPGAQEGPDVKVYDDAVPSVTRDEMVRMGQEMIAPVKEYNSDIIVDSGASKGMSRREFANSSGMEYSVDYTDFSVHVHGQWVRGTDILSAWYGFGWRKREIEHTEVARKATQLLKMAENIAPIRSAEMPVIFTPNGMHVLLLALNLGFNAKNVFLGSSPLAGRLGEKIADERFSLIDNPLIDYAANSDRYDGEGVPHQITPLISEGVAKNFLYDLDTAGRAGTKSTGNGVGCNPTTLVVKEGDAPYEEMVRSTKEGLLVHSVMGGGNPMSGEFSVNVQLGYKIENGEVVGRVKDVMLAGNTYDALTNIEAIGDKAEWAWGSLLTPPVKIGKLSVIAK